MKRFPSGEYGRQRLEFFPAPHKAPLRAFAVLVFPWVDERVLVCDIADRGWCIPSGRVEPGEASADAARREAMEEGGVALETLYYIGCYRITDRGDVRWADCYVGRVQEFDVIAMPEESRGRRLVTREELPSMYHLWNELTAMVFDHSLELLNRAERSV